MKGMLQSTARWYHQTEGLHFRQKKSVVHVIKGLGKIKVDDINRVAFVRHALHRFLEDRWYYGHLQGGVVALTYWREVLDGQNIPAILSEYKVEGRWLYRAVELRLGAGTLRRQQ